MLYLTCMSLPFQLKDMAERLPPGVYDADSMKPAYLPNGLEPNGIYADPNGERHSTSCSINGSSPSGVDTGMPNGTQGPTQSPSHLLSNVPNHENVRLLNGSVGASNVPEAIESKELVPFQDGENGIKSRNPALPSNGDQVEAEWIEQYEPGVYITLVALKDGTRDLKRVRFR